MAPKVVHSITDLIGDTPCVRLQRLTAAGCGSVCEAGVF